MVSVEHIVLKRCYFDCGSGSGFNYSRDDAPLVALHEKLDLLTFTHEQI